VKKKGKKGGGSRGGFISGAGNELEKTQFVGPTGKKKKKKFTIMKESDPRKGLSSLRRRVTRLVEGGKGLAGMQRKKL